jgi:hypothetical protein
MLKIKEVQIYFAAVECLLGDGPFKSNVQPKGVAAVDVNFEAVIYPARSTSEQVLIGLVEYRRQFQVVHIVMSQTTVDAPAVPQKVWFGGHRHTRDFADFKTMNLRAAICGHGE